MANVKQTNKNTCEREKGFAADGAPESSGWHKSHIAQGAGIQTI